MTEDFQTKAAKARSRIKNTGRTIAIGGVALAVLLLGSCSVASHSTTVEPGNAGVKIKTLGSGAGVSPEPLPARWYFRGIGERIVQYPVIQRTYSYTREIGRASCRERVCLVV